MTIDTMDTGNQSVSCNQAWQNAQAALAASKSREDTKSTGSGQSQHNSTQKEQSFITSDQQTPQQANNVQAWQQPPNQYPGYGYPPPVPAAANFGGYRGPGPNHSHNFRASYSSHFNQPPPGIRFTLSNQNRYQNSQPRYRPPSKPSAIRQPLLDTNPWTPTLSSPPPPPSNQNQTGLYVEQEMLNDHKHVDSVGNLPDNIHSIPPPPQQPIQQPVQQPIQQPIQQPVQQPVLQPVQQPVLQPVQQTSISVQARDKAAQVSEWPQPMKAWVTRCFAAAKSDADKDNMELKLKAVITDSFAHDRVNTTNWDTYPVPQLMTPSAPMSTQLSNRLGSVNLEQRGGGRGKRGRRGRGARGARGDRGGRGGRGGRYGDRERNRSRSRSRSSSRYSRSSRSHSRERYTRRRKSSCKFSRSRSRSSSSDSISKADFIPLHSKVSKKIWKNSKTKMTPKFGSIGKRLGGKSKRGGAMAQYKPNSRGGATAQYKPNAHDRVNIQKRMARFGDQLQQARSEPLQLAINSYADENGEDVDWDEDTKIIGTCQNIEKEYLRLTSAPAASVVRPLNILYKSLENVKARWLEKNDYRSTCEQFKSIRQDLTVQCIRDEFTAKVYEIHARVALEASDHCEFNQCQTQLKALYSEGVGGNRLEFTSYRILYYVFTTNTIDMISALASLTSEEKNDPCVSYAIAFRSAWSLNNYHQIFKLYRTAPKMTGFVIDMFLARERVQALKTMVKAYRPSLTIEFVQTELGYDDSNGDSDALHKFLLEHGAKLTTDSSKIECKNGLNPPPPQS